jgi:hypothetical protein
MKNNGYDYLGTSTFDKDRYSTCTGTACIPGISMQEPPLKVEPKELTLADIERLINKKHKEAQDERVQIFILILACFATLLIAVIFT